MNKNKMIKGVSCAMLLVAGGFAVSGITGCTKAKKEGDKFYKSLISIANNEFKKSQNIVDDKDYVEGLAAFRISEYQGNSTLYFSAYTSNYGIYCEVDVEAADTEEKCVEVLNKNYMTPNYFGIETKVGEINKDSKPQECFYSHVLTDDPDVDPRYKCVKPMKYFAFNLDDGRVFISFSCKNGVGNYISLLDDKYSYEADDLTGFGHSDEITEERNPAAYYINKNYIVK